MYLTSLLSSLTLQPCVTLSSAINSLSSQVSTGLTESGEGLLEGYEGLVEGYEGLVEGSKRARNPSTTPFMAPTSVGFLSKHCIIPGFLLQLIFDFALIAPPAVFSKSMLRTNRPSSR